MSKYYQVAANTPFNNSLLTYRSDVQDIQPGTLVVVPLGARKVEACILKEIESDLDQEKIKEISSFIDDIKIEELDLELYSWLSQYYHYPLGQLIADIIPKRLKRPRELGFIQGIKKLADFKLNHEQQKCLDGILHHGLNGFHKSLIHGVTGAGKTVVYLELIKRTLKEKKSVLFLLPEINLTPQFLEIFKEGLDVKIYSYNSSISNSDKYGLWLKLKDHNDSILILGVRSSVFLPVKNLGLIIVDEEHDQSFKQDDRCTYNARDVALKRASQLKIPIVIGSATPALESYFQFYKTDRYFSLKERAQTNLLPKINLVDMRGAIKDEDKALWPFKQETISKIKKALEKGEQVLIFINRLGYSSYLQCNSCGHQFLCPNCSTNLKYFKKRSELCCQTCEFVAPSPEMCPECMNVNLTPKGFGTEKVHELLTDIFPKYIVERFDRDEIKTFSKLESVLGKFHQKKIDILVGTQMLSKGHNFKNVNLVVVLGIDSQLNFPDFRSNERVYAQLTQVGGRAGRFGKEAEVDILTLAPENKIFQYVVGHSFDQFYTDELSLRSICSSPPFSKIILIYYTSKSQLEVIKSSTEEMNYLKKICNKSFSSVEILGPRPSFIEKKINKYTWSLMLRGANINDLHNALNTYLKNTKLKKSVSIKVDIDPLFFD